MAKHGLAEGHGPDKDEMLRYQAEDMARQAMMEMPEYKKMVDTMMGRLKEMQHDAQGMMKGLPKKKGGTHRMPDGSTMENSKMASVAPPRMAR